jgi:multicomponent K+:H+ antiporter subunit D
MMDVAAHFVVAPVVLPLAVAGIMLFFRGMPGVQAALNLLSTAALLAIALALVATADSGRIDTYLLGNWQAPFGIVLVNDRLSALMLLLTGIIALTSLWSAIFGGSRPWAQRGAHFHPLFQVQLMGLNGAFLTGDLFNLFVFFEVLLIASYGLLMHGNGAARLRNGIHFVVINLTGSGLFLIGVSLLYATTGTLNMADLAVKLIQLDAATRGLAYAACGLVLVVFLIKAAIVPVGFWLPDTYSSASAPVAALFVIMTKVGLYAIARVHTMLLSNDGLALTGVWVLAMTTLLIGGLGVLAARSVRGMAAYSVLGSAGFLLVGLAMGNTGALSAALFYLVFTTLAASSLYLLGDLIAAGRGPDGDTILPGARLYRAQGLAIGFFVTGLAIVGLPPIGSFIGKAMLLSAVPEGFRVVVWSGILLASLMTMVGFARAYSTFFWKGGEPSTIPPSHPGSPVPVIALLTLLMVATIGAGSIERYTAAAAQVLVDRGGYIAASLSARPVPAPVSRTTAQGKEKQP